MQAKARNTLLSWLCLINVGAMEILMLRKAFKPYKWLLRAPYTLKAP
jgi:hypothetical protein